MYKSPSPKPSRQQCFGDDVYGGKLSQCKGCRDYDDCKKAYLKKFGMKRFSMQNRVTRDIWACSCGELNTGGFRCANCNEERSLSRGEANKLFGSNS